MSANKLLKIVVLIFSLLETSTIEINAQEQRFAELGDFKIENVKIENGDHAKISRTITDSLKR